MIQLLGSMGAQPQLSHFQPQPLQLHPLHLTKGEYFSKCEYFPNVNISVKVIIYPNVNISQNNGYFSKNSFYLTKAETLDVVCILATQRNLIHSIYLLYMMNICRLINFRFVFNISNQYAVTNHNDEALLLPPQDSRLHLVCRNRQKLLQVPRLPLRPTSGFLILPVSKDTSGHQPYLTIV